jgi:glucose-6-phosphate 1-dehydrogenase
MPINVSSTTPCTEGMLFVREDAVEAAWAIVEPVLEGTSLVHPYAPGSWGPQEADHLANDLGGWQNLEQPSQ